MSRILMIDDDVDDQYFYRDLFCQVSADLKFDSVTCREELDIKVSKIANGTYRPPQLILLDLNLPKMSGKEIFKELSVSEYFKDTPIVALTTSSSPLDMKDCRELGFSAYFIKPSEFQDCKKLVQTLYSYWFVFNVINRD